MSDMKKIQSVVALGLMLLICLSVQAQWAGHDTVIVRKPNNSQKAVIGLADNTGEASYEWRGIDETTTSHILTNRHSSQVVVKPQAAVETFIVTRTTACGEEQDEVVVTVLDFPTLVSVIPKVHCYNNQDIVNLSDFLIETYPPGYENLVAVTPNHVSNDWLSVSDEDELTFKLYYNDSVVSSKTVSVTVYNDGLPISANGSYNYYDYDHYANQVVKLVSVLEGGRDLAAVFNKLDIISPCSPQFNINVDKPSPVFYSSCCNGEPTICFGLHGPSFSAEGGVECDVLIPGANFAGVAGLYGHIGLLMGFSIGPFDFLYKGECSSVTLPVSLYVEASGGLKFRVFSDDFFSASLYLVGRGQLGFNWEVGKEMKVPTVNVDLSVKGKVTTLGFFSYSVNIPLCSHQFFKN
jgi:hypothetical protein